MSFQLPIRKKKWKGLFCECELPYFSIYRTQENVQLKRGFNSILEKNLNIYIFFFKIESENLLIKLVLSLLKFYFIGLSKGVLPLNFQSLLYIRIEVMYLALLVLNIFEAFIFQLSVSWGVPGSCLFSKLPIFFPSSGDKVTNLVSISSATSWRRYGVTGAVLKVRKVTMHHLALWIMLTYFEFVLLVGFALLWAFCLVFFFHEKER